MIVSSLCERKLSLIIIKTLGYKYQKRKINKDNILKELLKCIKFKINIIKKCKRCCRLGSQEPREALCVVSLSSWSFGHQSMRTNGAEVAIRALYDCKYDGTSPPGVRFSETDQLYSRMKGNYRMGTAHSVLYLNVAAWSYHTDKSITPNYHVGIRGENICWKLCQRSYLRWVRYPSSETAMKSGRVVCPQWGEWVFHFVLSSESYPYLVDCKLKQNGLPATLKFPLWLHCDPLPGVERRVGRAQKPCYGNMIAWRQKWC